MPRVRRCLLGRQGLAAYGRGGRGAWKDVLRRLLAGELTEDEGLVELRSLQLEELGGRARLDLGRFMRRGIPEVVLATGKAPAEASTLAVVLAERLGQALIRRMSYEHRAALGEAAAEA